MNGKQKIDLDVSSGLAISEVAEHPRGRPSAGTPGTRSGNRGHVFDCVVVASDAAREDRERCRFLHLHLNDIHRGQAWQCPS